MKKIIIPLLMIAISVNSYAQEVDKKINLHENKLVVSQDKSEYSTLSYSKQIPDKKTYKIIKNSTGNELPINVLEYINYHRRAEEEYLWKVDNNVEILIYKFK